MTIQELIDKLNTYPDKTLPVYVNDAGYGESEPTEVEEFEIKEERVIEYKGRQSELVSKTILFIT